MRNIGIDVSKIKIDVYMPPETYIVFDNNKEGFKRLLKKLSFNDVIGVESTGAYHHSLALFFIEKGFEVREINPIITKQFIRATVRKKKTDKTDSKIISLLLGQGEGYVMKEKNINNVLQKTLRTKRKLIQMRTALKLQIKSLSSLKEFSFLRKSLESLVKSYDKQIEKLRMEATKYTSEEIDILESIPGISVNLSREILAELGDVSKFERKGQVVAYAGYDPKIKQSGMSNSTGSLTKRGSPHLRNALYLASFANIRSDNVFSRYYKKKKSEGKHHYQAITATSRKMIEIIFTLLINKQKFIP